MRIIARPALAVFALAFTISLTSEAQNLPPKKLGLPAALHEVSGMVGLNNEARDSLFLLNDSGNAPEIFKVNFAARQVSSWELPIRNRDWEDLAADPAGNLYIGDFGNNLNRRKDLRIYIIHPQTRRLDSILFQYPDQTAFPPARTEDWNFNCEAMVFFRDSLHLFSKNVFRGNFYTKHYTLPARPGSHTATLRDSIRLPGHVVTGASVSPDGRTLALISYYFGKKWGFWPVSRAAVFFFDGFSGSQFFGGKMSRQRLRKFLVHRQYESVVLLGDGYFLIANEAERAHTPAIRRLRKK